MTICDHQWPPDCKKYFRIQKYRGIVAVKNTIELDLTEIWLNHWLKSFE